MGYRVAAPLVYLRIPDVAGSIVSYAFYQGATVPDNVDEASLKQHLESGQVIGDKDPVADILAVPAGTPIPGEPPNVPVSESTGTPVSPADRLEAAKKAAEKAEPAKAAPSKASKAS